MISAFGRRPKIPTPIVIKPTRLLLLFSRLSELILAFITGRRREIHKTEADLADAINGYKFISARMTAFCEAVVSDEPIPEEHQRAMANFASIADGPEQSIINGRRPKKERRKQA